MQRRTTHCVDCGKEKDANNKGTMRCQSCARTRVHRARRLREMHDAVRRLVSAASMVRRYVNQPELRDRGLVYGYIERLESRLADLAEAQMADALYKHIRVLNAEGEVELI